jgi:hypothetical protein
MDFDNRTINFNNVRDRSIEVQRPESFEFARRLHDSNLVCVRYFLSFVNVGAFGRV